MGAVMRQAKREPEGRVAGNYGGDRRKVRHGARKSTVQLGLWASGRRDALQLGDPAHHHVQPARRRLVPDHHESLGVAPDIIVGNGQIEEADRVFRRAESCASMQRHRSTDKRCKGLGQAQHLTRLDLVGIRQLILVPVEDLHLVAGAAQLLLGNGAQGIFGFHRLGPARRRASYLDIRHDVLLPGRDGLDRVPDLVALRFGLNGSFQIELPSRSSALPWNFLFAV
jgi:hypothetical protein